MFDARVPKFRLARNHYGFSRVSGFLVGINRHEREHITSVTNTRTFTNKIIKRIVCFRRRNTTFSSHSQSFIAFS